MPQGGLVSGVQVGEPLVSLSSRHSAKEMSHCNIGISRNFGHLSSAPPIPKKGGRMQQYRHNKQMHYMPWLGEGNGKQRGQALCVHTVDKLLIWVV